MRNKKLNPPKKKSQTYFNKIILENFKGYRKKTIVNLSSGINVIYGKNSAGKSSIIQSVTQK